jgi:hypothetical protein
VTVRYFSLHENVHTGSGAIQSHIQCVSELFPAVKWSKREADHSAPSSAKIKEWSHTSLPPIRIHSRDRENFTSYNEIIPCFCACVILHLSILLRTALAFVPHATGSPPTSFPRLHMFRVWGCSTLHNILHRVRFLCYVTRMISLLVRF